MDVDKLIKGSLESDADGLLRLIERVRAILTKERVEGGSGNRRIVSGLVSIPPHGEAIIVGDLHADLESLGFILRDSKFLEKAGKEDRHLIFIGDYVDRGPYSSEVCSVVLQLKELFPSEVVLLRGNHEGPFPVYPHDFPYQLSEKFGDRGRDVYEKIRCTFEKFYHAVIVEGNYLLLHGGIPSDARSVEDIAYADQTYPSTRYLEEILWSDPEEGLEEIRPSPRGAGNLFGEKVTDRVLRMVKVKKLIRSHQPCEDGARTNHNGKVLTIFSRKGPPYYNAHGAYLRLDLSSGREEIRRF